MSASSLASLRALLFCSLPLLLTACPPEEDPVDPIVLTQARSSMTREISPVVAPADLLALEEAEVSFSCELYRSLGAEPSNAGKNLFFSPVSLYGALAMTFAGARGDTEAAMSHVLHASALSQTAFHGAFDKLDLALASRGQNQAGVDGKPFRLRITDDAWGQQDLSFEAPFLDTLAVNYGAGMNLLDFAGAPDPSRTQINKWVDQQTDSHISELLPQGSISSATKLVLTNAVYFNASWAQAFDAASTVPQPFHSLGGVTSAVPMMQTTKISAQYSQGDGWQYLALPYAGGDVSFDLVLPDAGRFAEIEGLLDGAHLQQMRTNIQSTNGQLALPRFSLDGQTFSAKSALSTLGMAVAFDSSADFSGITRTPLVLADVLHQAFVSVDERGTEATAATAVIAVHQSIETAPAFNLLVDRPFLFVIRDVQTSTILFAGRVVTLGSLARVFLGDFLGGEAAGVRGGGLDLEGAPGYPEAAI